MFKLFGKKERESSEMGRVAFLQSGSGTITLLIDKESHTVGIDHPNYYKILQSLEERDAEELLDLIDVPTSVQNYSDGKIKIQEGLFLYEGSELNTGLTDRIMKLMIAGHPFKYMLKFLNNLMDNPSGRAVQEGYTFLDNRSLPITEDGCFLAYKSVREDWTDWYSGEFDNSVGKTVSIARNRVDDNCEKGCSYGLHAGAIDYVSGYHGNDPDSHVVIVKINPKDIVSVPTDCDCTKIRVCSYEVVDVYEGELKEVLYRADVGNIEQLVGMFDNMAAEHWDVDGEEIDDDYSDLD
tara:strand:+ start:3448 stop:4332 length:885 start_codon:yes stop_codon:yes gene_type:complete